MPVTETKEALGTWEIELLGNVPREVLDEIEYFGHIAIIPGRMDPRQYGDGTLDAARYVGVVRTKKIADDGRTNLIQDDIRIGGVGMNFWLGDEEGKGPVIENLIEFNGASFSTVMNTFATSAVPIGTLGTVSGSYSGRHQYETSRSAIAFVCETMGGSGVPLSFRVNNRGTLDAGPESGLYVTTPTCLIVRKGSSSGEDMYIRSIPGNMDMDQDMEDFATRLVMLATVDNEELATGTADIDTIAPGVNVYKDIHGNELSITMLVSESDTTVLMADDRAEINLRKVIEQHRTLTLATDEYDIYGSFKTGDYVYVYDPDAGMVDTANEVTIRGVRLNPVSLQVTEADWPVTSDYTVGFRASDGTWFDLTDYVHFDDPTTSKITIGEFDRSLQDDAESVQARVASYIPPDSSIPDAPVLTVGAADVYLDANGFAKASQTFSWTTPLNTDTTAVQDGDHYELNVRRTGDTDWLPYNVAWGTNTLRLQDLAVGTAYEARVRAIDTGNNIGGWSATKTFTTSVDSIAPGKPSIPTIASSTLAVQVKHNLGTAASGDFTLPPDLAALEVHMSTTTNFTPAGSATYIGSLRANQGMIAAHVPAVDTFNVANTVAVFFKIIAVDTSGNKSVPSDQATTTATLVDSAHISDLTATKITAGTISSNILIGANISTAVSGARVNINNNGIQAFSSGGTQTVNISNTGDVFIAGQLVTNTAGRRIAINPPLSGNSARMQFYPTTGSKFGILASLDSSDIPSDDVAMITQSSYDSTNDRQGVSVVGEDRFYMANAFVASSNHLYYPDGAIMQGDDTHAFMGWIETNRSTLVQNFGGYVTCESDLIALGVNFFGTDPTSLYIQDQMITANHPFTAAVTTTTSGLTVPSDWNVISFNARETCGVVQIKAVVAPDAAITAPSNGNVLGDPTICTLPSGWRPTQSLDVIFNAGNTASGNANIATTGVISMTTLTQNIAAVGTGFVNISATFVQ
jgi:hypothetical protein